MILLCKYIQTLRTCCFIIAFQCSLSLCIAQDILWSRTYGEEGDDVGLSVRETADGCYIVAGYTESFGALEEDVFLLKTDANGNALWIRTYGSSDHEFGHSVQQTADGGYIIGGRAWWPPFWFEDIYLVKTDSTGDTLWTKRYGEGGAAGYSVQQTFDGGYIVGGVNLNSWIGDYYLVKTNSGGDTSWTRTYIGMGVEECLCAVQTTDSGYVLTGSDVSIIKTDQNGTTMWIKQYGGLGDATGRSIQQTSDGGYIIAGWDWQETGWADDILIMKTDEEGDTTWSKTYGYISNDHGHEIQQTSDGGYIVAGYWRRTDSLSNIWVLRTDETGDTIWTKSYGGEDYDEGYSVRQTADGGYIVTGYVSSFGAGNRDVFLMKINGIKLISPDGDEILSGDTIVIIRWRSENPSLVDTYRLLFSTDGGSTFLDTVAADIPADTTTWAWQTPQIFCATCRVKIQALTASGLVYCEDASNDNFSIIETIPPWPFGLVSPPDSAMLSNPRPTFVWETAFDSISGLREYEIYIGDTMGYVGIDTSWMPDFDLPEGFSNWYVVAYDSAGNARNSSDMWTVIIDTTPPSSVDLISPLDYSFLSDTVIHFAWHLAYDNLTGIDRYLLQYGLDSFFIQGFIDTTVEDTTFTAALSDTTYYWRVKAFDNANNSGEFSSIWRFGVGFDSLPPTTPNLLSPISGMILNDTLVTFEWSMVTNLGSQYPGRGVTEGKPPESLRNRSSPIRYIIQIDTLLNFPAPMCTDTLDTVAAVISVYEYYPYCWRVRAYDWAGNQGFFSDPDSFGVDVAPVIESTTVWTDTSYTGPFEILTKVTDIFAGIDSVTLFFKRDEDSIWLSSRMNLSIILNWFIDSIPEIDTLHVNDTVRYYIEAVDSNGNTSTDPNGAPTSHYSFVADYAPGICERPIESAVEEFNLECNPIRDKAIFHISLGKRSAISMHIYDACGRLVCRPIDKKIDAGNHKIVWDVKVSAGVYFYVLGTPNHKRVGKLIVIR